MTSQVLHNQNIGLMFDMFFPSSEGNFVTSYLQKEKSYQTQILHLACCYDYNESRKVSFNRLMLILIFGTGSGEGLKRPGQIGLILSLPKEGDTADSPKVFSSIPFEKHKLETQNCT